MKYYKIYICIILRVLHQNRRLSIFLISPKEIIHKSIFRRPTNNIPNNFHWACSSSAHAIGTYERKKIWKEWGLYKPLISILINSTNNADTGGLDLDLQPQNLILFYQTYGSIFHFWWSNLNIKSYFGKWLGSWVFLIKHGTIIIISFSRILAIHQLTKEMYIHYLTLAMPSRYRIVPSLAYEYPSPVRYSELSRYSPTW